MNPVIADVIRAVEKNGLARTDKKYRKWLASKRLQEYVRDIMQLDGATPTERELYEILLLWENEPASEWQTRVSEGLNRAIIASQKMRKELESIDRALLKARDDIAALQIENAELRKAGQP